MRITCTRCGHRFEHVPAPDSSEPVGEEVCPQCGAAVDLGAQISEFAAQTTEDGSGSMPAGAAPGAHGSRRSIGEYEILEEVSRGAMGVVYKARHRTLGRVVALKVMIAGEHASPEQVARFEKEARAAARLRHPNIVPIYEIGVEDGKHFFTMDFIEGTPLDVLIARRELTPRRALEIAAEVSDALEYAHSRHVIHRDIKPGNIMIDASGRPQIMDFGLAKEVDTDVKFTRTGTTIGTPSYMPPEQARGDNDKIDFRSDVYSLGAVLYEMLTGQVPFTGETMMNIVMKVIHDDPLPPRRRNPRLHRDIQTIVLKAMEKDPARRYQSMAALSADIRRYVAGEMISARPAGPVRRVAKTLRRHRAPILAGLVIALLVSAASGAIIYVLIERTRVEEARRIEAERERMLSLKDQDPEWVVQFTDDFSKPELDPVWKPSAPGWSIKDGCLRSEAERVSSLSLDRPFEGTLVFEFTALTESPNVRITCFLGRGPRAGYNFRFGNPDGSTLSLERMQYRLRGREIAAQTRCPPIEPNVPYRVRIERRNTSLVCRVTGNGTATELRYDDPELLKDLGRTYFGFDAVGPSVRFDDVEIRREEFAGPRLNVLQFVEFHVLSRGQLAQALEEYASVIRKHGDQPIGVLAEHYSGLIQEAMGRDPKKELQAALGHYESVERRRALLPEKYRPLLMKNRERMFFVKIDMLRYGEAASELASWCKDGHKLDPGAAWRFPAVLSQCADDGSLGPALEILESARFAGPHTTLRDCWLAAGPAVRRAFADALNQTCKGFAAEKKYAEMKRAFLALPDTQASRSLEPVVAQAVADGDAPLALDLLGFVAQQGMSTSGFERSALTLAQRFLDSKQYARVANVHTAYPTKALTKHFGSAVAELAQAGRLDDATELLDDARRRFPEDKRSFHDAAGVVMTACQKAARPDFLRRIYGMFGDPRLARWLVEAADEQLRAGDRDGAFEMMEYLRKNVPGYVRELARLAGDLAARFAEAKTYERLLALSDEYPTAHMASAFADAITDAASSPENRDLLTRLLTRAIGKLPREPRLNAAVHAAAAGLVAAGEAPRVLRIHTDAAQAAEADKNLAAAILYQGGGTLLDGKAYAPAAAAYLAAGAVSPEGKGVAPRALLRAAVINDHLGKAEEARQAWQSIVEKYPDAVPAAQVARFMTGAIPADEFRKWCAENPSVMPPTDAQFFLGFHAAVNRNPDAARPLLRDLLAATRGAWFATIAQATLDALPQLEPKPEPKPE